MSEPIEVEVCIIGGGVSGLKAAHTLLHHPESVLSPNDLILLEAQDRLGGRIYTDKTSSKLGLSYDLGASWFHDSLNNVVLSESIKDDTFDIKKDGYYDDKDMKSFASELDGPLDVNNLKLHRVAEDIEKYIELHYFDCLDRKDVSLCDIVGLFMEEYGDRLTEEQKHYCGNMLRYLELWYGITWDKISAKYAVMDHQGRNLFNKKGYSFVIDKLLAGVPSNRILKQHPVASIIRNNKGGKKVCVDCTNGTKVLCNYLVVTVPQSILSLAPSDPHAITWTPPLPSSITDALNNVHFGALGKVIFEFESPWWDINEDRFEVLPDSTENTLLSDPLDLAPDSFRFPVFVVNYGAVYKDCSKGASFCILTQAPLTNYLESNPHEAWSYFKPMLSKLAVDQKIVPDPINTVTSNWTNNPYIRGSYTAVETGDDPLDIITQLSGEHQGGLTDRNIRFAGEHTILDGSGCVHGAYMSGDREGVWIVNDMKASQ